VAYVARVDWSNRTVFLVSDNYAVDSDGYTSSTWAPFTEPTGYIHLHDLSAHCRWREKDQASFVASSCATVRSVRSPKRRTTDSSRLARTRGRPRAR